MVVPLSGSNSVGRVRPCQGRCRRFESGLPLQSSNSLLKSNCYVLPLLFASLGFAQYKMEPTGALHRRTCLPRSPRPSNRKASRFWARAVRSIAEVWFAAKIKTGPKSTDDAITLSIPQGDLSGRHTLRWPAQDRRGQSLKAGTYTMRYSQYPVNGDHQGVAPQRDFAVLVRASDDADPGSYSRLRSSGGIERQGLGNAASRRVEHLGIGSREIPELQQAKRPRLGAGCEGGRRGAFHHPGRKSGRLVLFDCQALRLAVR